MTKDKFKSQTRLGLQSVYDSDKHRNKQISDASICKLDIGRICRRKAGISNRGCGIDDKNRIGRRSMDRLASIHKSIYEKRKHYAVGILS